MFVLFFDLQLGKCNERFRKAMKTGDLVPDPGEIARQVAFFSETLYFYTL